MLYEVTLAPSPERVCAGRQTEVISRLLQGMLTQGDESLGQITPVVLETGGLVTLTNTKSHIPNGEGCGEQLEGR